MFTVQKRPQTLLLLACKFYSGVLGELTAESVQNYKGGGPLEFAHFLSLRQANGQGFDDLRQGNMRLYVIHYFLLF